MRRCRAVISLLGLLALLALPGAASATDKPYSVLERIPTAHGCLFASFTAADVYLFAPVSLSTPGLMGRPEHAGYAPRVCIS
jgi:hypothetical protein